MKTYVTTILLSTLCFNSICAQDKLENAYNKWSLELNIGQNKPEKPFATGYFSSDPNTYFNFNGIEHIDFGVRYMFNPYFGGKVDVGYDILQNQSGTASLPFETKQYRVGLQGIINFSRLLKFETFSNRFGLLAHGGLQVSQLAPQMGINKGITEQNGGLIIGLTPQVRISNRLVLNGDFSYMSNVRQHLNWDGSTSNSSNNLAGSLFNTSLGLTVYLGKNEKHADWYTAEDTQKIYGANDAETKAKIEAIEILMQDTDKDGVPDYLDRENNTPGGVAVDTRGRFIDKNNNGTPDELEPQNSNGEFTSIPLKKEDAIKALVEKGYVNVFFDVNKDDPNAGSTNNVYHIINFLRNYPDAKAKLVGYADVRGNESKNKDLSQRRAQRVYNIIVASGINANRVSIEGQGVDASYPADSKIGLDLARRVSVIIE